MCVSGRRKVSRTIVDLLMNEEERCRLVKNGFEIVKAKGDFAEEMKKVDSLYDDLVKNHLRRRKG